MIEIVLPHPVAEVMVFYVKEYDAIILRQDNRNGYVDILMTASQLVDLVKKMAEIKKEMK